MIGGVWGFKVGMTQIFSKNKVIPVTVVDVNHWVVINNKSDKIDGRKILQVACIKKRYRKEEFSKNWLKKPKKYFSHIKSIDLLKENSFSEFTVGQSIDFCSAFDKNSKVDVIGRTRGLGFAGVIKRYNFAGPPGSHGSTMGNRPGSIGFITACGKVTKGKKMPGRLGNQQRTIKNLNIVEIEKEKKMLLIQGSVPGKTGTSLFVRKI